VSVYKSIDKMRQRRIDWKVLVHPKVVYLPQYRKAIAVNLSPKKTARQYYARDPRKYFPGYLMGSANDDGS
jgi:hypothetical protein